MLIGKRGLRPLSSTVLKEINLAKKLSKKVKANKKPDKKIKKPKVVKKPLQKKKKDIIAPAKIIKKPVKSFKIQEMPKQRKDVKEEERAPTGIPGLDEVMAGGFERGSNNLIAGGAGSGKSIFGIQFIVTGIEEFGEPGVFVTFEEKKENVYKHMLKFGWDLQKYEDAGKFEFVEYTPEQVKKMLDEGGGLIESLIKKIGAKRIVIDSISAFTLLFKGELARREATLSLINLMRKWETTAILTAEFEPDLEKPSSSPIEFEVDSIILLYYPREGDTRKRALEILKMRGTEHSKKIFPLKITEKGITIYPKERIF